MSRKLLLLPPLGLVFAGCALWWLYYDMQRQLQEPLPLADDSTLFIAPGEGLNTIAAGLVKKGWLEQPYYFIFETRRQGRARLLKAGEYEVTVGTTPLQLLDILVDGKVRQYSMTIPEGWSFRQILRAVRDNPRLLATLDTEQPRRVMAELGYSGIFAEGRIYPDTYFFPAGTTDREFLRRAIKMQEKVLMEEWRQRAEGLPYASPYEALIMASIVEKETAVVEERERIAGVFVRRLQQNMKLQTDPTVIYALGQAYDGDIRRKDLSIDSPYNTYLYRGLPPTPIASPGREAIHAALHPEPGTALYFVARGDGSHYFSDTLAEHNRAVEKYQLGAAR